MASCSRECRMTAAFIIIMIYAAGIFILSIAQLFNKGDYGYKKILSYTENFINGSGEANAYCDDYVSDLKFKIRFAKVKTIINVLYNFYLFIYSLSRVKEVDKDCRLGMLFSFILLFGNLTELVLTSMAFDYFDSMNDNNTGCYKTYYKDGYNPYPYNYYYGDGYEYLFDNNSIRRLKDVSSWVIELDKGIIVICAISVIPIFYLFFALLCEDCDSYHCIEKDLYWIFSSIYECLVSCCCGACVSCCESFGNCCRKCKGNDSSGLEQTNKRLVEENNNLKNNINNLSNEIKDLKRENVLGENNFNSERIRFQEEILILNQRTDQNLINEKNLKDEFDVLKQKYYNLFKEKEELENKNKMMNKDLENMENKLIHENIELKQLNIFQFYSKNKLTPEYHDKNSYFKNIVLKELNEINDNYGLNIDSNKFKEISLYYIKSKLTENLTDSKTKNIFSNPVISQDGKTYEKLNNSNKYIENKLVLEICKILKENEEELTFDNFQKIKKLLISKETGKYYKNPVVITSGVNIGETTEDIDNENKGYQNKVIKNIIEDIRELLDDDFFKYEMILPNEITTNNNNDNALTITGFADV